jgi:hypothetical protein
MFLRNLNLATLVSIVVLAASSASPALADNNNKQKGPMPQDRNRYQSRNNPELEADNLKEPIQLPDLPTFTGQKTKFILGSVHQAKQGPNYIEKFRAKEEPKQVIEWYKNTLQMYKWKISVAAAEVVQATNKDGSTICVLVSDLGNRKDGDRTAFEINYFQQNH